MFKSRPSKQVAEQLYAACAAQARRPVFYTALGVPDRIDARFELYTLHVLLVLLRLREEGQQGAETAQDLFDTYVSALDNTLRELGVGDVAVGKKMRRLGEAMYGRMAAYEKAILAADEDALATALARNIVESEAATAETGVMAGYAMRTRAALAKQSFEDVKASPAWAELAPEAA
ncbi:MAG: ubiquinol-cytochrome C chaperone family protein [Brevundimonas sp.]